MNTYVINKSDLPSKGILYPNTPDEITIRAFGVEEMMMCSASVETEEDTLFVKAVQASSGLSDTMTSGDFYAFAAIIRVLTFPKSPIEWLWTCSGTNLQIAFTGTVPEDGMLSKAMQIDPTNFIFTNLNPGAINKIVTHMQNNYENHYRGSLQDCGHNNKKTIDVPTLIANFRYIDETQVETADFIIPRVDTIPEYRKLFAESPRLRKLLPMASCLNPNKYGNTLMERITTLRSLENAVELIDDASKFYVATTHGIVHELLCPPCDVCQAQTDSRTYSVSAHSFFR